MTHVWIVTTGWYPGGPLGDEGGPTGTMFVFDNEAAARRVVNEINAARASAEHGVAHFVYTPDGIPDFVGDYTEIRGPVPVLSR